MKITSILKSITTVLFFTTKPVFGVNDCGCSSSCTSSVLDKDADGHTARGRIDWVMENMRKSEKDSCQMVCGDEFPNVCGKCAPRSSQCRNSGGSGGGGGGTRCGCSSCNSSIFNGVANGYKVVDRIDWVKNNMGMSEQSACVMICGKEFPNVCSQCDPNQCDGDGGGGGGSSGGALSVVTQNLQWHILFNQHGGRSFFDAYKRQGLLDIYLFQECEDVNRVKSGLGFSSMSVKQFNNGLAISWDGSRFRKISDGSKWVGRDRDIMSWDPNRYVVWVRLQERSTGKIILAACHHGPLAIDTGGNTGPESVATQIHNALNGAKGSRDVVLLGGDFNAHPNSRTMRSIQAKGYRTHATHWVDHILTKSGLSSSPQKETIQAGSDHLGVKTRWSSF